MKGIELTPSQIKAYENGATKFIFPIKNYGFTQCEINEFNENTCSHCGHIMYASDKHICPNCEGSMCYKNFSIQKGDKDILMKEYFDFNKHYCNATFKNFEALKKLGFKPLNNGTQKYLGNDNYMLWTGKSSWDFENKKIIDEFQAIYARSKCELFNYTKYEMILENDIFVSKDQSRYSFSECIDVKVIKVQDMEWVMEFHFPEFYNRCMQERNINRTYEDNDYVFSVEFKK